MLLYSNPLSGKPYPDRPLFPDMPCQPGNLQTPNHLDDATIGLKILQKKMAVLELPPLLPLQGPRLVRLDFFNSPCWGCVRTLLGSTVVPPYLDFAVLMGCSGSAPASSSAVTSLYLFRRPASRGAASSVSGPGPTCTQG